MKIQREPLWGAVRNILIIICTIIIVAFLTSMTTMQPTTISNPMASEQSEVWELNQKVEEKLITESTESIPHEVDQPVKTQSTEVVVPQPVEDVVTYQYGITSADRETLARLVFLESNTESLECQKAIASVVINRMHSGYWGSSINSVVYARNQFTPSSRIPYTTPTATNYEAVDYVLTYGVTLPTYVLYFRASHHFSWKGYVPYTAIGNTYFGYMAKDKH